MGLQVRTRVHLATEGIDMVEDLAEFAEEDSWRQVIDNCRRPPKILNAAGNLVEQEAFHLGAKSLRRLQVAAKCVHYYLAVGRDLSPPIMQWSTVLKNFEEEWKAIMKLKDDDTELPKITNKVGIVKWIEAYESYASTKLGVRDAPLSYVIREVAIVPPAPPIETGKPYSTEHGSVKHEMIARLSHQHALFKVDNAAVFDDIEEATRGTKFASSIAPFKRTKNGRGALLALKDQHAGKAMWDGEAKRCTDFMLNRKFTGGTSMTLDRFLSVHRQCYVNLERCAENIDIEIPNERTRVGYLIDNIEVADADVKAAIASIKLDDGPGGLRTNFERAVALLVPVDPSNKKRGTKRAGAEAEISAAGVKQSVGPNTGVEIRYYKKEEYNKLSKEEQDELRELRKKRKTNPSKRTNSPPTANNARFRASVVNAVKQQLLEEEKKKNSAIEAIAGILKTSNSTGTAAATTAAASAVGANKRVNINEGANETCEVAAAKLYGLINSFNSHGKSTQKSGKALKQG